jgi:O-antigen/teichoic acid export membrane protein
VVIASLSPTTEHDEAARDGAVLAHGALYNALAFLASNLRGIFTFLIARLLGSATLGTFGLAWAVTDLVGKLATCGLDTGAIAMVAEQELKCDPRASRRIMRASLGTALAASSLCTVLAVMGTQAMGRGHVLPPEIARATSVMLLGLPGIVLYRVSNALSRGKGVMHHDVYSRGLTESLGTAAALVVAYFCGVRLLAPEIAAIVGTLASGFVAFACARRLFASVPKEPIRREETVALLRRSIPIAFYDLINIGIMRVDLIMLGLFVGRAPGVTLETVGIYAVALDIAGGLRKVSSTFTPIFVPIVAQQLNAGPIDRAERSYGYLARWMLAMLLPALAVISLAAHSLLRLFGPAFPAGAPWLVIVATACAVNSFVVLGEMILMIRRPAMNLLNSCTALAVTIGLNLMLIPRLGPLGAAIGMIVAYSVQGTLRGIEIPWLYGWRWPWRDLAKPWLAALAALPLALLVRLHGADVATELTAALLYLATYLFAWRVVGLDSRDRAVLAYLLGRSKGLPEAA